MPDSNPFAEHPPSVPSRPSAGGCCAPSRPEHATVRGEDELAPPASAQRDVGGMVQVPGGTFRMGTDDRVGFPNDGEGPIREVQLSPFLIDACAVTNTQFATFIEATGYIT